MIECFYYSCFVSSLHISHIKIQISFTSIDKHLNRTLSDKIIKYYIMKMYHGNARTCIPMLLELLTGCMYIYKLCVPLL